MYLKQFILFIVVSSVVSLIWSMINYSHYIQSQLWSPQNPPNQSQISTITNNEQSEPNDNPLQHTENVTKATRSDSIPQNISYLVPPIHITSETSTLSYYFDKSVIFMGMINNAEWSLPHILSELDEVSCLFNNILFFFFESNSVDLTSSILREWFNNKTINCDRSISVYKYIIYGDDIVEEELNIEIKRRSNSSYTHKLSRVEKFVPYRNMMLSQLNQLMIINYSDIVFDYLFMIDIDVFEIDFMSFLSELIECDTTIMCINGVDQYNDYRDSYATVEMTHNWVHRPFIFNKTDSYYDKARNILRKKMPRKNKRFEYVRSCFNGLTAYNLNLFPISIHSMQCKYHLDDDILLLNSQIMDSIDSNYDEQWIIDVTKLINWSHLKGAMFDNDAGFETNLCEHIAFHYCLSYLYDITISIAKNTKLYYYPLVPPQTKEDRRAKRRRRRRQARQQQRRDMFLQH